MRKQLYFKFITLTLIVALMLQFTGCAHMMTALDYSEMQVKLKMSDTIFLEEENKAKNRRVYVAVSNTSDMQEVDIGMLKQFIASKLASKGYQITDASRADYIIQVNVLYMDYYRETGTQEGGLTGGLVGATAGVFAGSNIESSVGLGLLGGLVGTGVGALIGKAVKIETYAGVVDVQIKERTDKPVKGQVVSNAKQGSSTRVEIKQDITSNYQIYRTQIACVAQQTNINKVEAARAISERIASQIAGIF